MSRRLAMLASALLVSAVCGEALAQGDVAAAEALFREARSLMKAGEYEKACPKLEESQRLDPGVGTLANLARCYEETRRLASAWAKYLEASEEAQRRGEHKRAKQAASKAAALEPLLHRLAILVPRSSRIDGLVITRNGVRIGSGSIGSKVPIDEGEQTVAASADGHEPWQKSIRIAGPRLLHVVEVPRLAKAPEVAVAETGRGVETGDGSAGRRNPGFEMVPGEPWFKDTIGWGLVAGGVVVAGGGFGALLRSSQLLEDSREPGIGVEEFDRRVDSADRFKLLGNGLLITGAAVAVIGAVKLAIAPAATSRPIEGDDREPSAQVLIGPRSVGVRVRF